MASLPYPRSQNNTPTEFTEFTEQTGREYYPTDFTDLHRYLLPQNSRNSQNRLAENILPQISKIYTDIYSHRIHGTQNRLAENIIPQISQIYTDIYSHRIHGTQNRLAENIIPQISQIYTDIYSHRIHGIHRTFCLHLCKSVKSVGVSSQQ